MEDIRVFEKERIISFSNRTELIHFVSKYLADQYKKDLEFWRDTTMGNMEEISLWQSRIEKDIPKFEAELKRVLPLRMLFCKKFTIRNKSLILKIAFKLAGIKGSPAHSFAYNVVYKVRVDQCSFQSIIKPA